MALIDQKKEIEKINQKNQAIYIAYYVWGKNPEEYEEKESGPIPGVDIPINPELVKKLF